MIRNCEVKRKHTWTTAACAALFLCLCVTAPAAAFELGARGLYWFPSLTADIKVDDGGVTGDKINLKDTLGIEDESYPSFEVFLGDKYFPENAVLHLGGAVPRGQGASLIEPLDAPFPIKNHHHGTGGVEHSFVELLTGL